MCFQTLASIHETLRNARLINTKSLFAKGLFSMSRRRGHQGHKTCTPGELKDHLQAHRVNLEGNTVFSSAL